MANRTYDRSETCNKTWILSCMSLETQGQNLKRNYTQFVCKVESQDGMVMWVLREVLDFINTIKDVSLCLQVSLPRQVSQSSWKSMFLACHFNTSVLWKLHLISCIYLAFRILILNRSPDTNETYWKLRQHTLKTCLHLEVTSPSGDLNTSGQKVQSMVTLSSNISNMSPVIKFREVL